MNRNKQNKHDNGHLGKRSDQSQIYHEQSQLNYKPKIKF